MEHKNNLVDRIRERPTMYLGRASVECLSAFLGGYFLCASEYELNGLRLFDENLSFHDWVALRTHQLSSAKGWVNMLNECYKSEDLALENFFIHYYEYIDRVPNIQRQGHCSGSKRIWREYKNKEGNIINTIEVPEIVKVVKYTDDPGSFVQFLNGNEECIEREEYVMSSEITELRVVGLHMDDYVWEQS